MPPKKQVPPGPRPVEAFTHVDKRANLPTADAHEFVSPEVETPFAFRYPREVRSPQLVWRGKEEQDLAGFLEGNAPPIYIQEKIDPRVIIENLRDTAAKPEEEPELTLFDVFDGLGELDLVDFYQHQANWSNRMILGDSLQVMASLAERERLRGKVQMIYIDPPYGIKFGSNWQVSARNRDVKDGKIEDATRQVEQIKAFRDTWEMGIHSYLTYLRDRLTVAKELLTDSGSIFVQIGDENVHLVRSLMDEVFGSGNFVSMISFNKSSGLGAVLLPSANDYILWYGRNRAALKFRQIYTQKSGSAQSLGRYNSVLGPDGTIRPATQDERQGSLAAGSRLCTFSDLTKPGPGSRFEVELGGRKYRPEPRWWGFRPEGFERLRSAGRIAATGRGISFVRLLDDFPAFPINNVWTAIGGIMSRSDPKIYVVQTSTTAIQRCMLMCSDPGDLVLDPTCGSGTTAYVAEQWGRRWITIDTSRVALALARQRLMGTQFPWYYLADSDAGRQVEAKASGKPLPPAQTANDIRHGFVYERVQHVTLKAIANNPDIREGMSRAEVDAAIKRHAEFELLHDKPFEENSKIRVAGPFTVESLSPYRAVSFAGGAPEIVGPTTASEDEHTSRGEADFEQEVIENLRVGGIQNGRKHERLAFASIDRYASPYIQARGISEDADGGQQRVGLSIGPQYGTVGPTFIKEAARAAINSGEIDLLCILAFAFDPAAVGTSGDGYVTADDGFASVAAERRMGRVPVLLVRMNSEIVLGELKKTGAGNLFTVFGEPDIDIQRTGDSVRVVLLGVDVFDPNTGEVRSRSTDEIALWMIDTNYNGESFFVRHCYFTGGNDPYRRLKTALKAEIDEAAWASLNSTESRPFARPETGKVAVKVINDYGDEVMKVFTV